MIYGQVPVRQMLVHDTWAARDLPVLDATVSLLERSYMVTVTDIAASTGLDATVVAQALDALDPVYVDFRKTMTGGDPRFWYVFRVTPEARRAVGQWPTAEALADRLAAELSAAAREADSDRQGLLTYAARLIGDTLRDETLRAASAVLSPAFGGVPVPEKGQQMPSPEPPAEDVGHAGLVPLPELPELLRERGTRPESGARREPVAQREPGTRPEPGARRESAAQREPATRPEPGAGAADADADGADTDVNVAQSRPDPARAV